MGKVSYQSSVQFMQLPEQMMTQITDASKRLANGGNDYRQWSVNLVKLLHLGFGGRDFAITKQ